MKLYFIDNCGQLPFKDVLLVDRAVVEAVSTFEPLLKEKDAEKVLQLPAGEAYKTLGQVEMLYRFFLKNELSPEHTVTAVGGGTLLDTVGFAAATFKRGIRWQVMPTTLLAMVDAAIGGKCGVNYQGIKNCIGAYHEPTECCICFEFLKFMPLRLLQEGVVEMIKHAFIDFSLNHDLSHLELISKVVETWDLVLLQEAIRRSIQFKRSIIARGAEWRHVLNFGHTFGHALEAFYGVSHGAAVLLGLIIEGQYVGESARLLPFYEMLSGLHFRVNVQDFEAILQRMKQDKKNRPGEICLSHPTQKRAPLLVGALENIWKESLCLIGQL